VTKPSRQFIGFDFSSIISIIWFLIIVGLFMWFYNAMKRMQRTLEDIKEQLQSKSQAES